MALPLDDGIPNSHLLADDVSSDYGSDFSPEQDEILNQLLAQIPSEGARPSPPPRLIVKDIEDHEISDLARVPHAAFHRRKFRPQDLDEQHIQALPTRVKHKTQGLTGSVASGILFFIPSLLAGTSY